jgi:hypothetical protein
MQNKTFGGKVIALLASAIILLLTNILTITRQGLESWWSSLVNNGKLHVVWVGPLPEGVTIEAKNDAGKGIEFDPNDSIGLPAGIYKITVQQYGRQLPVTLFSPEGASVTNAQLQSFHTTNLTIKPTPIDPLFANVYDLVADALGRPKGQKTNLKIVYEGFHENGTILWFFDTNTFYILRATNGSWTDQSGPPYPTDPCLYDQACIDRRDQAPRGFHAPIGGGNAIWKHSAKDLGWMLGYCIYHDAITQEGFENGFLLGPLAPASFGNIAMSLSMTSNKHTWRSTILFGQTPAKCSQEN